MTDSYAFVDRHPLRNHPNLRNWWGLIHDIYWRCRNGSGNRMTRAQRTAYLVGFWECEALIHGARDQVRGVE